MKSLLRYFQRGKGKILRFNKICTQTQSQKEGVRLNRFIFKILKNGVILGVRNRPTGRDTGYSQSETKGQR